VLIGTPGRIADHIDRGTFRVDKIQTLILDEFDKSLEVGFEEDMKEIIQSLPKPDKIVLTSATQGVEIPDFVGIKNPLYIDYLGDTKPKLEVKTIISPSKDKLETLFHTICHLGNQPGIVFCNFKDSNIIEVWDYSLENVKNFNKNGIHNVKHVPFCLWDDYKRRLESYNVNKNYEYDVVFVGWINERRGLILFLKDSKPDNFSKTGFWIVISV
jgi:glycosyltransferase involved in cell wall biosynthesis